MKGKKVDTEFVSSFITNSISRGFDTQDKIVSHAKTLLHEIDEEIMKFEEKKATRSKLLDVISSFEKPVKVSKSQEARILSFFQIESPHICQNICQIIKTKVITLDQLSKSCRSHSKGDIVFCVKQLLEHKVLAKTGEQILRGDAFEDYLKFVLREG
jgi:uncharacterized protein YktA (UPF0223 family)